MTALLSGLFLVSSLGLASCGGEVPPNFEDFPLDVQATLRWGTEGDTNIYLDLTITNNTDMTVKEMSYYSERRAFFDTETPHFGNSVLSLEFSDGGLKPHTTIERALQLLSPEYVYNGKVAKEVECELIIWWIRYDKKGADWGDKLIEQHFLDEHGRPNLVSDMYAKGHSVEIANSKNPF